MKTKDFKRHKLSDAAANDLDVDWEYSKGELRKIVKSRDTRGHYSATDSDDDDDDDSPTDVKFDESRQLMLKRLKAANDQILQKEKEEKLKRRNRNLLYEEQKKRKIRSNETKGEDEMAQEELTDDELDTDDTTTLKLGKHLQFSDNANKNSDNEDASADVGDELDFIPLTSNEGGVRAMALQRVERLDRGMDAALAFRNKHMFGSKIKRETVATRLNAAEKKRALRYLPSQRT